MNEKDRTPSIGVTMVIFIAFALVAVILLSSTLLNAVAINTKVTKAITPEVQGINSNLNSVPLLDRTNTLAGQIMAAAQPLSGEAGQIVSATSNINTSVSSIHDSATAINGSVSTINDKVSSINSNLGAINDKVSSINGSVGGINSSVSSVGSHVNAINASVGPINVSVHNINGNFTNLLPVTVDIRGVANSSNVEASSGVAGINDRADAVIGAAGSIKTDTATITGAIGTINTAAGSINGHAANIDSATLLTGSNLVVTALNAALAPLHLGPLSVKVPSPKVSTAAAPRVAAAASTAGAASTPATPSINTSVASILNGIIPAPVPVPGAGSATAAQTPDMVNNMLSGLGLGNIVPGL